MVFRFGDIVSGEARSACKLGEGYEGGEEGHGLGTTEPTNGGNDTSSAHVLISRKEKGHYVIVPFGT